MSDPFTTDFGFDGKQAASQMTDCLAELAAKASRAVDEASSNPNNTSYALRAQLAMGAYQQAYGFTSSVIASTFTTLKEAVQNIR